MDMWICGHLDTYGHMEIIEKDNSSCYSWWIFPLYVLSVLYLLSLYVLSLYSFCHYTFCPFIPFVVIHYVTFYLLSLYVLALFVLSFYTLYILYIPVVCNKEVGNLALVLLKQLGSTRSEVPISWFPILEQEYHGFYQQKTFTVKPNVSVGMH